ncbi:acyl-CoA dehydrogenase C-terminal domain-containing protein [Psychrobium sp. 1_MG-2023]|uniref:acyl-CoA dehydrogenase C-terminal domain-containing protein n=1 Tax=Psychrobium sp. 1_MG-2023 TaxID=3062624 RepID=UPI000C32BC98|nr:acyl-CoA dehydrogenase C-terminal domain-containing protein [Psychrobium sp. 1_MG-2023]MDP2560330.1 acyl-CoA dehydrogenase C-terminal domain-containing protein [Psychrobium sp. 1_MG-2023]PKF55441.1 acyl-CoA dehydrogenase [Alteromonadales bacterium alter-6D02]
MTEYQPPLQDMSFLLKEVFDVETLWQGIPTLQEAVDVDTAEAILEEAGKLASQLIAPLNRIGDEEGATFNQGEVTTPTGFKEAFNTFAEGGWSGLCGEPTYGGMGMPKMLGVLFDEMMYSANTSFTLYPTLTSGACLALNAHGSDSLKEQFLPPLYSGRWSASMCLTEPHSGTDLGLIRTKAVPNEQGSYDITGTKIFITGGEHDLNENIIHLVLAKLPDAAPGARGISLFLVPKINVENDQLTTANNVSCGSIEHKMGIKASSTCVMNFDASKGYLIGEKGKGLACMFTMMNYERLSIGIQGIGCGEMAYQGASEYAKDRRQSKGHGELRDVTKDADPIIVHGDVRRMLLTVRANNEASRAFALYIAKQLDLAKYSEDEEVKQKASCLVALLTPVAKAFFTDLGLESTILAQQVFGGHGYIREWGMEQLVRDVRIAQIYEGTNGIQALDLIGRKVAMNNAKDFNLFIGEIRGFIDTENVSDQTSQISAMLEQLSSAVDRLESVTQTMLERSNDGNELNANAVDYLNAFGYTAYAYMWCMMSVKAKASQLSSDNPFYDNKLCVGQFFFARLLPKQQAHIDTIYAGASSVMAMPNDMF